MSSFESLPLGEQNPRLQSILEQYGNVPVLNHENQPQPLAQAVDDCPPFVNALLGAQSPEQLQQIVDALKAPE
jgi:hypothetical protein